MPTTKTTVHKRYEATAKLPFREIAKVVRRDIAAEMRGGKLPQIDVSVTIQTYSMGRSMRITVKGFQGVEPGQTDVLNVARLRFELDQPHAFCELPRYSDAARKLLAALEEIGNRANWSESDSQADYHNCNYYLHVGFDSALETAERENVIETFRSDPSAYAHLDPEPSDDASDETQAPSNVLPFARAADPVDVPPAVRWGDPSAGFGHTLSALHEARKAVERGDLFEAGHRLGRAEAFSAMVEPEEEAEAFERVRSVGRELRQRAQADLAALRATQDRQLDLFAHFARFSASA